MNDNSEHENGYCVLCGSHSSFGFDPTIITLQLQKAWGISDNVVEAFNRKKACSAALTEPAYHSRWGREDLFVDTDFGMHVMEKLSGIGLRTEVFYLNPKMDLDVAVGFDPTRQEERWK